MNTPAAFPTPIQDPNSTAAARAASDKTQTPQKTTISTTQAVSQAQSQAQVQAPTKAAQALADQADLRLVIEEDKASGSYVYKTVDAVTGAVVSVIPRAAVQQMQQASGYQPGSVVDTRS